jgi:hypothetical protein
MPAILEHPRGRLGSKISSDGQLAEAPACPLAGIFACVRGHCLPFDVRFTPKAAGLPGCAISIAFGRRLNSAPTVSHHRQMTKGDPLAGPNIFCALQQMLVGRPYRAPKHEPDVH